MVRSSLQHRVATCYSPPPPPPPPPPSPDDSEGDDFDAALSMPLNLRGGGKGAEHGAGNNSTKHEKRAWHAWCTHAGWTQNDWWERLPGGDWNPVTIFWRIKQKGPYTKLGLNHMNPICKIVAFQMKEMLHLQTLALMGQVSKVVDKSLRPKLTEENWWDLMYCPILCTYIFGTFYLNPKP
jgi:hypothetical protein